MSRASGVIVVRPARGEDRPGIAALNAALQAFEQALRPERCPPAALPARYLDQMLARADGGVLVAADGEAVVGFLAWREEEDLLETAPRGVAVTDLVVAEAYRGRGVGRTLLAHVEALARASGAARLRVTALAANEAAVAAYAAWGFRAAFVTLEKTLAP